MPAMFALLSLMCTCWFDVNDSVYSVVVCLAMLLMLTVLVGFVWLLSALFAPVVLMLMILGGVDDGDRRGWVDVGVVDVVFDLTCVVCVLLYITSDK